MERQAAVQESPTKPDLPEPPSHWGWKARLAAGVLAVLVITSPVTWSISQALTRPGNDSTEARLAEWARDHHGGALVTWLERTTYSPPRVGGLPPSNSPLVDPAANQPSAVAPSAVGTASPGGQGITLPPPLSPLASPPLPGEGKWLVVDTVRGRPAMAVAYLRPDATHTSYTSMVAWMDPDLVRAVWHPGTSQPGDGPWPTAPYLAGAARTGLLAAFNSAFRLQDSRGGFYADGRTVSRLRSGAASLVIDTQGHISVGAWGREVTMSPDTAVVRQNLALLVDNGVLAPGITSNAGDRWGATLGNAFYVWRSGIGVTADGAVVYVAGDRLSALTLARLLQRAGAVHAMELDINPDWTSFILYDSLQAGQKERDGLPDMARAASRYDTTSSRDFIALYRR